MGQEVNQVFDKLTDINVRSVDGWDTINTHCGTLARNLRRLSILKKKVQRDLKELSRDNDEWRLVTGLPKWKLLRLATDYEDILKTIGKLGVSLSSMNTKLKHSLYFFAQGAAPSPPEGLKISTTKVIAMGKEFLSQMVVVFKIL